MTNRRRHHQKQNETFETTVIAIGLDVRYVVGESSKCVCVGNLVLVRPGGGTMTVVNKTQFLIYRESRILGKLNVKYVDV